jgi:hypothetical protein
MLVQLAAQAHGELWAASCVRRAGQGAQGGGARQSRVLGSFPPARARHTCGGHGTCALLAAAQRCSRARRRGVSARAALTCARPAQPRGAGARAQRARATAAPRTPFGERHRTEARPPQRRTVRLRRRAPRAGRTRELHRRVRARVASPKRRGNGRACALAAAATDTARHAACGVARRSTQRTFHTPPEADGAHAHSPARVRTPGARRVRQPRGCGGRGGRIGYGRRVSTRSAASTTGRTPCWCAREAASAPPLRQLVPRRQRRSLRGTP